MVHKLATDHFSPKMANQNIKQDTLKYANGQSNLYKPTNSDSLFCTLPYMKYVCTNCVIGVEGWSVQCGLLSAMRDVTSLYACSGMMTEANYYAREGLVLATRLALPNWYVRSIHVYVRMHAELN